ncbi:MAG: Glu/Leu/Phe/Val dehydrogenase dimerization domain-containing protein [Pseudomonadales bacterium]
MQVEQPMPLTTAQQDPTGTEAPSGSEIECEELVVRRCQRTGLHAAVAIHSTTLGPAAGGCRRWVYADEDAGLADARRLAEGMSYKNALAGIPFGGGKSVIFATDKRPPTEAQLVTFAGWLNDLQGRYITAEDVGMGVAEMRIMAAHTPYVSGSGLHGVGGDPSPKTAYGVFLGLKSAVQSHLGREHLYGVKVAVQGLGAVGLSLCHWLARAGAELVVADLDATRVGHVVKKYGAQAVDVAAITSVAADVFAPCAMGGVVDQAFAESTQVRVVAGAANNQLSSDAVADILQARGVLYAPDFVLNAGGVISVAHEYMLKRQQFDAEHNSELWVSERIEGIRERLLHVIRQAQQSGESTQKVAKDMALARLAEESRVAA